MTLASKMDSIREDAKTMTTGQLATKHGYNIQYMYKQLRRHEIKPYRSYRSGRVWTKEDYRILDVYAGKINTICIGKLLNRTPRAIKSKCESMGISYGRFK